MEPSLSDMINEILEEASPEELSYVRPEIFEFLGKTIASSGSSCMYDRANSSDMINEILEEASPEELSYVRPEIFEFLGKNIASSGSSCMDDRAIPSDMMYEIMSRASLETLARCRLLSRGANDIAYESGFLKLRSQRTNTVRGVFINRSAVHRSSFIFMDDYETIHPVEVKPKSDTNNSRPPIIISLDFIEPSNLDKWIEASTRQGLVLCSINSHPRKYAVCKPTTRQYREIPYPDTGEYCSCIGISVLRSDPLRFKVVRFSREYKSDEFLGYLYEVFDSGPWCWKKPKMVHGYRGIVLSPGAVSACGALHWFATDYKVKGCIGFKHYVFAFDVDQESWRMIQLPTRCGEQVNDHPPLGHWELVDYQGKLGLTCLILDRDLLYLWVYKYGRNQWTEICSINMKPFKEGRKISFGPSVDFCGSDVALVRLNGGAFTFFNFKKGIELGKVSVDSFCTVFHFESDFAPTNFMGNLKHAKKKKEKSILQFRKFWRQDR